MAGGPIETDFAASIIDNICRQMQAFFAGEVFIETNKSISPVVRPLCCGEKSDNFLHCIYVRISPHLWLQRHNPKAGGHFNRYLAMTTVPSGPAILSISYWLDLKMASSKILEWQDNYNCCYRYPHPRHAKTIMQFA